MRAMLAVGVFALLWSGAAGAQTAPPAASSSSAPSAATPSTAPPSTSAPTRGGRGGDISRDEYIQRAVERARHAAETRFDRLDTNHDGILTADERRAARAQRRAGSPPQ